MNKIDKTTLLKLIIKREVPKGGIIVIGKLNNIFKKSKYKEKYVDAVKK